LLKEKYPVKQVPNLIIIEQDARRLRILVESASYSGSYDRAQLEALEEEMERAVIVPGHQVPENVVTMHSRVRIIDMRTGEQMVFQLVYPHEAKYAEAKISILAPIGMALLGYAAGTVVEWEVPSGKRTLRIEAVEHQPEAAKRRVAA
jgi:regulator of nucleoside diphosphate kinase